MTNAQCEKISIFWNIYTITIYVIFEEFDKDKQIASVLGFTKILKEIAGHIYGTVDYSYIRGDFHESELHIIYAVIENNLVALRDLFDLYHFSKESGEFYGHTRIETTYKLL